MDNEKLRLYVARSFSYIFLIALAVACVIPFYVMIINGTRTSVQINFGLSFIPGTNLLENWINLIKKIDIIRGFINSAIIAVSSTAVTLYMSALTAWAFAIYNFRFKKGLWWALVAVIMIPNTLGIIGFYQEMLNFHLIDNFLALILPAGASSVTVFFLRQFIHSSISYELVEAAEMDGAKPFYIFHRIAMPLMVPGLATMGIFSFVGSWNGFLGPLIILYSKDNQTLPLLIVQLNSTAYKTDFGVVYLAVTFTVIPILIAFAFLSRFIITGLTVGGSKE